MREAIIQSTHLNRHKDLIHVRNLCIFDILFVRMNDFMYMILFQLPLTLLESIEVVEERIQ
jgi:hypothetical protein